jgi:hypothetical protein
MVFDKVIVYRRKSRNNKIALKLATFVNVTAYSPEDAFKKILQNIPDGMKWDIITVSKFNKSQGWKRWSFYNDIQRKEDGNGNNSSGS